MIDQEVTRPSHLEPLDEVEDGEVTMQIQPAPLTPDELERFRQFQAQQQPQPYLTTTTPPGLTGASGNPIPTTAVLPSRIPQQRPAIPPTTGQSHRPPGT
jgi:hypothetical protein